MLVRDFVLLAQFPLVRLDLLGEGRAQLELALLRCFELAAEILDLRMRAVQLDRGRRVEVVVDVLRFRLLDGLGL